MWNMINCREKHKPTQTKKPHLRVVESHSRLRISFRSWKIIRDDCTALGHLSVTSTLFKHSYANSISGSYDGNFCSAECSYKSCLLLNSRHNSKESLTRKQRIIPTWITGSNDSFPRTLELTAVLNQEPGHSALSVIEMLTEQQDDQPRFGVSLSHVKGNPVECGEGNFPFKRLQIR